MTDYNNRIFLKAPAKTWAEGYPVGCGRIGAMIGGGIAKERITLNEEHIWGSTGITGQDPNFPQQIQTLRELLLAGKNVEADRYARSVMTFNRIRSFEYAGELHLQFHQDDACDNYFRTLDLREAIAYVNYDRGDTHYHREHFVSYPDNVMVFRFTSDNEPLNMTLTYTRPRTICKEVADDTLSVSFRTMFGDHVFYAAVKAVCDGNMTTSGTSLVVTDAHCCTLYVKVAKTPDITFDELCYETLKQRHIDDFAPLMDRADLDLEDPANIADLDTGDRLEIYACNRQGSASLATLCFRLGRYLLAASSRPGTLPSNLQGIWTDSIVAPWSGDYHLNINLQCNYWPAEVGNLSDCHTTLLEYANKYLLESARKTAQVNYNCRGAVCHHLSDIYGFTGAADGPQGFWPMGGAWLCYHFWEHYLYTEDKTYLKDEAYTFIKDHTRFLLDYMFEDENGYLMTGPSMSPENKYFSPDENGVMRDCFLTLSPAVDIQVTEGLLKIFCQCSDILGLDADMKAEAEVALTKLCPMKVGSRGHLVEWNEDYQECTPGHFHSSNLFGLFPGNTITPDTPEIYKAAQVTLDERISNRVHPCHWGEAWHMALLARLHNGNRAFECFNLKLWYNQYVNMLDHTTLGVLRNPDGFQIDGNLSIAGALAEMYLQSHAGYIELLPAVPRNWPGGKFHGLCARGGFEVSAQWKDYALTSFSILSKNGEKDVQIQVPENTVGKTLVCSNGEKFVLQNSHLTIHVVDSISFTIC